MTSDSAVQTFWAQNQFVVALTITLIILAVAAVIYALHSQRHRLAAFVQSGWVPQAILLFRFVLGAMAILALTASVFPRDSTGMGVLLYFILWPLLVVQLVLAFKMPWKKTLQEGPGGALAAALGVGFYAGAVDFLMFQLTGYIG